MGKISFLIFLMFWGLIKSNAQTCTESTLSISSEAEHVYSNSLADFSLSFNSEWGIVVENEKAIIVAFSDNIKGNAGVLKNQNGYYVQSAHEISESVTQKLLQSLTGEYQIKSKTNTYLKNIKTQLIEYDYKVNNLGDIHNMSGMLFLIVKGNYTYIFMFNCFQEEKSCYIPFFKNVMKNAYFGQSWYQK